MAANEWNGGGATECANCARRFTRGMVQMLGPSPLCANLCRDPECERTFKRVHRDQHVRRWDTRNNPLSSLLSFGGGR